VPGPAMLTKNLDLVMSFVWLIVVANIITVAICFLFIEQIARITFIRGGLLIPPIVLLVYIGAFAEKNAVMDLMTMLFFGLFGLLMVYFDWPRPPLVLGLVLGRLAENYLFLSQARYGLDWLSRPIVMVLIVISLISIFTPLFQARLNRKLAQSTAQEKVEVFVGE
jgi:TctA family transporter